MPTKKAPVEPTPDDKPTGLVKQKSFASDVNISLFGEFMNMSVDLKPLQVASKKGNFKMICATCDEATTLSQQYVCPNDETHTFIPSTAARARVVDDMLYKVTPEEIAELTTGELPPKSMVTEVYPADQVERSTRPVGVCYRLVPKTPASVKVYALVRDIVVEGDKAFVGEMTLRSDTKLFRLEVWNGQIILQELARPEDVAPVDNIEGSYDGKHLAMAKMLIDDVSDFDPAAFRNKVKQRMAEFDDLKRAAESGNPDAQAKLTPKPAKQEVSDDAMMAALEAALAAKKAAKPAAKTARGRKAS